MQKFRRIAAIVAVGALITGASACSSPGSGDGAAVTLDYWMWDDTQVPAYEECATEFTKDNPNIKIKISQAAWSQYWTNLTTQIAAGSAPDVWVDQVSYYPQFVENNQIVDIAPMVEEDNIDLTQYVDGMAELWTKDGARYGLPKDWDTMGLVYNKAQLAAAGYDEAAMSELEWNPDDGGTFEDLIAALTVDANGNNGLDPAFDQDSVAVHGFLPEWADGSQGQNGWGNFAHSNGWTYSDVNPFGTEFNYSDPELVETIDWLAGLADKGYAPPLDMQSAVGRAEVLISGSGALTTLGSFNLAQYKDLTDEFGFAPLPFGPEGRKSAINGLSDAIYAGSKHQDEAWEWVKYLASAECHNIVAESGVVFPANKEASVLAAEVREGAGLNTKPFLEQQQAEGGTFIIPISLHGSEINQIVQDAIQSVALGSEDAATALNRANEQINALFQ